ncbi:MAG: hypothetical protein SXQ77_02040, partial [Halobacteria archaeon]|nr:hypothetical protein [Halobacteria archaeon]
FNVTGVLLLVLVVVAGFVSPSETEGIALNFAILVVWVGWWAGYTASVYLVGNTWRVLNPWRTVACSRYIPSLDYEYRGGILPSVIGVLALVWIEVVSPVSENSFLLSTAVVVYTVVTLAGYVLFGDDWFEKADPVTRIFDNYGWFAPVERDSDSLKLRLPGARLRRPLVESADEVAFVIALLWSVTFDGLVGTPAWGTFVRAVVGVGVPVLLTYTFVLIAGFVVFFYAYRLASRISVALTDVRTSSEEFETQFAPSLIPIAVGYHLAHFLGFFVALLPSLVVVVLNPFGTPSTAPRFVLPPWFTTLSLLFVVVGHLFAVWVAHSTSFNLIPGRLQPIRSQYPYIVVMVFYTMVSLWIVSSPEVPPPYL